VFPKRYQNKILHRITLELSAVTNYLYSQVLNVSIHKNLLLKTLFFIIQLSCQASKVVNEIMNLMLRTEQGHTLRVEWDSGGRFDGVSFDLRTSAILNV